MALRASSATARPPLPLPPPIRSSTSPSKTFVPITKIPPKSIYLKSNPLLVSLPTSTSTALSIFTLFTAQSYEARAICFPKEQVLSSLNQVEPTIDQVQDVGSSVFDVAGKVIGTLVEIVKPGIDVALPILKQAAEWALKIASPAISEASKKAQEAIQSSGIDTDPVITAAKNYILIDIRSEKDKDKAGVPRLPSNAKNRIISIPYSDTAKIVARTLTNLGFKNSWVVADGFSGSKGWLQSRLGTDSYNVSFAEVLSPSRIIPASARRFGTTGSAKLLPRSSD